MKNMKKKVKILVVDDETIIQESLRDWLSKLGHRALEIMEKKELSIVIADLVMPGMDGIDTEDGQENMP